MVFFPIASAALTARQYFVDVAAVARCLSMWSIAGITMAMLGMPREKKSVASLNICVDICSQSLAREIKSVKSPSEHLAIDLQLPNPLHSAHTA